MRIGSHLPEKEHHHASAKFWDKLAEKYAKHPIRDPENYHLSLERTRSHLKAKDQVLELGCGTGSTALLLAPEVAQYTGSDMSGTMITIANRKLAEADHPNLDFIQATADDTAPDAPYDAVLAFNLLHLVDDLAATLAHIHTMIGPAGLLISKTPCLASKKWLFGPMIWVMQKFGKAPPVLYISAPELEHSITQAGFEIIEAEDYGSRYIVARKT